MLFFMFFASVPLQQFNVAKRFTKLTTVLFSHGVVSKRPDVATCLRTLRVAQLRVIIIY